MGLSNASGHPGAQGDRSARGCCARSCATRLLMLMALVLSAGHAEGHAGLLAKTLIQRSIPVAAALSSQTITFVAPSGKTYGVAPFTISATASSGLAGELRLADDTGVHCQQCHGDHRGRRYVHDSGVTGGQCNVRAGTECKPELHRIEGESDDHIRRARCPRLWRRAVCAQRDSILWPGGQLRVDDDGGLHGQRQHGDHRRRGDLQDSSFAGGQRQLQRRDGSK